MKQLKNTVKNKESGVVAIIVALMMTMLLGFLGLAIDASFMYVQKARLQSVADASALACVIDSTSNACGHPSSAVNNYSSISVTTTYPITCPDTSTQHNCAQSVASTTYNTFFIGWFGIKTLSMSTTAQAGEISNSGACLYVLADIANNGSKSTIDSYGCAIVAGSISKDSGGGEICSTTSGTNCADTTKQGSIALYDNGSSSCSGCTPTAKTQSGSLTLGMVNPTLPDFSGVSPVCQDTVNGYPKLVGGVMTAVPGTYCNKLSLSANTTFGNGQYVLKNGISNNGFSGTNTCSGTNGVSFYVPGGSWNFSGSGNVNFCAPTDCTASSKTNGYLVYQPASNTNGLTLSGSGNTYNYTGILAFPGADFTFNGAPVGFSVQGSLLIHSLTKNGNNSLTIQSPPNACNIVTNPAGGKVQLVM